MKEEIKHLVSNGKSLDLLLKPCACSGRPHIESPFTDLPLHLPLQCYGKTEHPPPTSPCRFLSSSASLTVIHTEDQMGCFPVFCVKNRQNPIWLSSPRRSLIYNPE